MNDNFEINDWVKITMKNKSVICGQVTALGKKLVDGEEHTVKAKVGVDSSEVDQAKLTIIIRL